MLLTKTERSGLQTLISDTVLLLCKNGLGNKLTGNVTVHGLIGVSINDEDLLLVDIRDSVQTDGHTDNASAPKRSDLKRKSPCEEDSGECSVVSVSFFDEPLSSPPADQSCDQNGPMAGPVRKRRATSTENNNGGEKSGAQCCTVERRASVQSYVSPVHTQSRSPAPIDLTFSKSRSRPRSASQTSVGSGHSEPGSVGRNSPGAISKVLVIEPISPGVGQVSPRYSAPVYPTRTRRRRQQSHMNDEQINSEVLSHIHNIKAKLQQKQDNTDTTKKGSSTDKSDRSQFSQYISVQQDTYLVHAEEKVQGHIQAIKDKLHVQPLAQRDSSPHRDVTSPHTYTGSHYVDRLVKIAEKNPESSVKSHLHNLEGHLKVSSQGEPGEGQSRRGKSNDTSIEKGQVLQGDSEVIQPLGVMAIGTLTVIDDKYQGRDPNTDKFDKTQLQGGDNKGTQIQGEHCKHIEQNWDHNKGNVDGNSEREHSDRCNDRGHDENTGSTK